MPAEFPPRSLDELLQPIAPDAPAGASLRYEGTYDKIRDARRADDPSLPQGEWQTTLKKADFDAVASLCTDAIAHRSKDLQLAVWLVQAWTQLHGVGGVPSGLGLMAGLCDRFWESMYPLLAEGGAEERAGLIDWMDDTIALRLRLLPLSDSSTGTTYSLSDWEAARGRIARPERSGEEPRGATWEAMLAQTSRMGRARWQELRGQVSEALRAADELELVLAAKVPDPPIVRRIKEVLRSIAGIVEQAARTFGDVPSGDEPAPEEGANEVEPAHFAAGSSIKSRSEAYLRLSEIADFLLRTEPHSPVPYLIMRAVSWGDMSLAELLHEFVDRADDLVAIQVMLGMRKKE